MEPFSAQASVTLTGNEEKEIFLPIPRLKEIGEKALGLPYIVAVTDASFKIITHHENFPFSSRLYRVDIEPKDVKKLDDIQTIPAGMPLLFKAENLVVLRLNEEQPLFFKPVLRDVMSIKPDEGGKLEVRVNDQVSLIQVKEAPKSKIERKDETPPGKISELTARSHDYVITINWQAAGDDDVDHYNVYRLKGTRWVKLKEVKMTEYIMEDTKAWNSYTFRIAAVDRAGNEGKASDPCGIVATK